MLLNKIHLVTLALVISLHSIQAQIHRSEYYAVLPFWESAITPWKGACPITEKQAEKLIHLKLDYDNQNRVIQAAVRIGHQLKAFEGRLGNLYINAPLTKVTYTADEEEHLFFDQWGKSTTVMQDVHKKIYERDRYGRNVSLRFEDDQENPAKDFFGYVKYVWTYLPDGSVIEERFQEDGTLGPLRGEFQFMRTRITFGPDGYPSMLQNVDESGKLVNAESGAATFKYFYDNQGRFSRWEVYDKDGNPATGPSGTSGEQNVHEGYYLKAINFFDGQGNWATHWSGAERWYKEYDRYGNTTKLAFQNPEQKPKNGDNGYAEMRFHWTPDGRHLLEQTFHDASGQPVNHPRSGVARKVYVRNALGEILEVEDYVFADGYQLIDP